jgi:hypothetical protein
VIMLGTSMEKHAGFMVRGRQPAAIPAPPQLIEPQREAAHEVVRALQASGVSTYFGVPGGPVMPFFDAILKTPGVQLVESRHETNAAFAAAGYWRATGKVPAVVVTSGPGATNVVTGIVSAYLERVPMLLICGGLLGFLPILGFWMLPLGLLLLAEDVPPLKSARTRILDWIERRHPNWLVPKV